jgi:hypothetical protein
LELFTAINALSGIESKRNQQIIHVYHGGVRFSDDWKEFPIQRGSCHRDSANCLNDKERHPMLLNVIKMALKQPAVSICLTRDDTKFPSEPFPKSFQPCYAYRMNREKSGHDEFYPCVDLFSAPVEFWQKILTSIPDMVMGSDSYWSRVLLEIFKMNGAKEVEGVYRHVH